MARHRPAHRASREAEVQEDGEDRGQDSRGGGQQQRRARVIPRVHIGLPLGQNVRPQTEEDQTEIDNKDCEKMRVILRIDWSEECRSVRLERRKL